MLRIREEEVNRIKQEVSLAGLVKAKGITLKPHGKDKIGHCPFHKDKTPSLIISPGKNLWHCLGACNTGGSVIDWVMKIENLGFKQAVELLQRDFFPLAASSLNPASSQESNKNTYSDLPLSLGVDDQTVLNQASYSLKLLQSEGVVSIASTGKDESSGDLVTKEYKVEGPVMLFLTTTAIEIDEELLNRCMVLTVNESREQTQAIHEQQRDLQTLAGLLEQEDKKALIQLHQNAQRLLTSIRVVNPYAKQLTFASTQTRMRRDHMKYLSLIRSITLLHQQQREIKTVQHHGKEINYIEVTLKDIEQANRLAHEVLGRSLDELPPQTRRLLQQVQAMVKEVCEPQQITLQDYRFSRKDIRAYTSWNQTQTRVHMDRLVDMEYVLVHRGSRGQSFAYELLYQGESEYGEGCLMHLLDVNQLKTAKMTQSWRGKDSSWRGHEGELAGPKRPHSGGLAGSRKREIPCRNRRKCKKC